MDRSILLAAAFTLSIGFLTLLGAPIAPSESLLNQARPVPAPELLACPIPVHDGETWISRRWMDRGELKLECIHIAGFPALDWPTARKVGLVP
jgi:hypothetical protein